MAITYIAADGSYGNAEGLVILRDDTKMDYEMTFEMMELASDIERLDNVDRFMLDVYGEVNFVNIGKDVKITEFPKVELQ